MASGMTRNERVSSMMKDKTYYLAGPMSGLPANNIPAFDDASKFLRTTLGLTIISPAELDDPEIRLLALADEPLPPGNTWGVFLARDVKIVADQVQGMILLPGWEKSRGARLESYVGILCKHEFWLYPHMESVGRNYVLARL